MHCFVSMYLSGRKSLFNVLSLSSKHGVSSVPCIVWSAVSMSFYCWNTYLYWEYLIPLITVILSHRALLISELEKTTPPPPGCEFHVEMQKSGGRGEERLFSRALRLHWARLYRLSFLNEGRTYRWWTPPAIVCKQDHCSHGEVPCWNGQYLWLKLTWGLNISEYFQFDCSTRSRWLKDKQKQTNHNPANSRGDPSVFHSYFCLGGSGPDKGLVPTGPVFFPGCSVHSLFLRSEHTLM